MSLPTAACAIASAFSPPDSPPAGARMVLPVFMQAVTMNIGSRNTFGNDHQIQPFSFLRIFYPHEFGCNLTRNRESTHPKYTLS